MKAIILIALVCVAIVRSADVTVHIKNGRIQGFEDSDGVLNFLGIPYAQPPINQLRWRPPVPPQNWNGVKKTIDFSSACIQPMSPGVIEGYLFPPNVTVSEDCLYLNVYAPSTPTRNKHVMVWFHGGGLTQGGNSEYRLRGNYMARTEDVVVVVVNYRLGLLGFLAHPYLREEDPRFNSTGNYGLLDQRLALRWVRENIEAFGGDPLSVTIFGESAGGSSTTFHLVMPGSRGLFKNAIIESSAAFAETWLYPTAMQAGTQTQSLLKCPDNQDHSRVLECMRSRLPQDVLSAQNSLPFSTSATVDGLELPDHPFILLSKGEFNKVPLLAGNVFNEGSAFVSYLTSPLNETEYKDTVLQKYGNEFGPLILNEYPCGAYNASDCRYAFEFLTGDVDLVCPTLLAANAFSKAQLPTYGYVFAHTPSWVVDNGKSIPLGAYHSSEIPFVFSTLSLCFNGTTPAEHELGQQMTKFWTTFGKTSNPNYPNAKITWPSYTTPQYQRVMLNENLSVSSGYHQDQCAFWAIGYEKIYSQ